MKRLRVDARFQGPTLVEMTSLLGLSNEPLEVKWGNTKPEIRLLQEYPNHDYTLVVASLNLMERTATALGLEYVIEPRMLDAAAAAMVTSRDAWRDFISKEGTNVASGILLKAAAQDLRAGHPVPFLRAMVHQSFIESTSPVDADILLNLFEQGALV